MTPERSQITPAIAPKISGTARTSPPATIAVNGMNFPAPAQHRNDIKRANPPIMVKARDFLSLMNRKYPYAVQSAAMPTKTKAPVRESISH